MHEPLAFINEFPTERMWLASHHCAYAETRKTAVEVPSMQQGWWGK